MDTQRRLMKEGKQGQNIYEAGRAFYVNKLSELDKRASEVATPFEALEVQDERELMELKLIQLNRREQVLEVQREHTA